MQTPHPYIDRILPLDEAACETLGHVRHFRGTDTVATLSAMFGALATPPINAALWENSGQSLDPVMLHHLRQWSDRATYKSDAIAVYTCHVYRSCDMTKAHIANLFNAYAEYTGPDASDALRALNHVHDHIQNRIAALQLIFPDASLDVDFRMGYDNSNLKLHTDGCRGSMMRVLRLLEPLGSDGTILCDNRDFGFSANAKRVFSEDPVWRDPCQKRDHVPVAYQAPGNSLLMISNELHHSPPIVHCSPAVQLDRPDSLKREVICYDLALPIDWYKTFKPI